jgi:hypothetical protein
MQKPFAKRELMYTIFLIDFISLRIITCLIMIMITIITVFIHPHVYQAFVSGRNVTQMNDVSFMGENTAGAVTYFAMLSLFLAIIIPISIHESMKAYAHFDLPFSQQFSATYLHVEPNICRCLSYEFWSSPVTSEDTGIISCLSRCINCTDNSCPGLGYSCIFVMSSIIADQIIGFWKHGHGFGIGHLFADCIRGSSVNLYADFVYICMIMIALMEKRFRLGWTNAATRMTAYLRSATRINIVVIWMTMAVKSKQLLSGNLIHAFVSAPISYLETGCTYGELFVLVASVLFSLYPVICSELGWIFHRVHFNQKEK